MGKYSGSCACALGMLMGGTWVLGAHLGVRTCIYMLGAGYARLGTGHWEHAYAMAYRVPHARGTTTRFARTVHLHAYTMGTWCTYALVHCARVSTHTLRSGPHARVSCMPRTLDSTGKSCEVCVLGEWGILRTLRIGSAQAYLERVMHCVQFRLALFTLGVGNLATRIGASQTCTLCRRVAPYRLLELDPGSNYLILYFALLDLLKYVPCQAFSNLLF